MKDLNPLYSQEETLQQLRESFTQSSPHLLHLPHFFSLESYESLLKEAKGSQGQHQKTADRFSYTETPLLKSAAFLQSSEFCKWLSSITDKKLKKITLHTRSYTHRDYTLLHDSETIGKRLEFFILIMKTWDNRWGGHTVYVAQDQEPLLFPLEGNSFSIIDKEKGRHKFVQYINHYAGKEKLTMIEGVMEEH